jgi:phosphoribosylformylglycinamidine cyclo-ligase
MYQVFNCGHRLEFYVNEAIAEDLIAIASGFGVDAQIIGRVAENELKKLTIKSEFGTFRY